MTIKILHSVDRKKITISATDLIENGVLQYGKYKTYHCKNIDRVYKFESKTNYLKVNNEIYRGKVLFLPKKCVFILETPLEVYLRYLLNKEMNANWPIEALKAQAIVARSYAIVTMNENKDRFYHLKNSEYHQVSGSLKDVNEKVVSAVNETRNMVLKDKSNNIVKTFYHASCGGKTILPEQAWSNKIGGYRSIFCSHCFNSNKREWKFSIPLSKISKILSHRKSKEIDDYFEKKSSFRKIFGAKKIKSNNFHFIRKKKSLVFRGKGLGHGVGLCQDGTFALAKNGHDHKYILRTFYPEFYLDDIF